MFQISTCWNIFRPDLEFGKQISEIKIRGYSEKEAFLQGEFARAIKNKQLKSLSVSDIADTLCPTRRDLFYTKRTGVKSPDTKCTWGRVAGPLIELHLYDLLKYKDSHIDGKYSSIEDKTRGITKQVLSAKKMISGLKKMNSLKSGEFDAEDPTWFAKCLGYNVRFELAHKFLNEKLKENKYHITAADIKSENTELHPDPLQIGISKSVRPDFLIERLKAVGDIKSGIYGFCDSYLLTCAGYAMAYENEKGKGNEINFGIIYYFPTRLSTYVNTLSFPQVYIFEINDKVRQWFIDVRNRAYSLLLSDAAPDFPPIDDRKKHCNRCKHYDNCKKEGLKDE